MIRKFLALSMSLTSFSAAAARAQSAPSRQRQRQHHSAAHAPTPTTASAVIKHVVVIFGENISFDHYFGTYPNALNNPGGLQFTAATGTPIPNNYIRNPACSPPNPNLTYSVPTTESRR